MLSAATARSADCARRLLVRSSVVCASVLAPSPCCGVRRGPFCLLTCLRSWSDFLVTHSLYVARQETIFDRVLLASGLWPCRLLSKSLSCAADGRPSVRMRGRRVHRTYLLRDRAPQFSSFFKGCRPGIPIPPFLQGGATPRALNCQDIGSPARDCRSTVVRSCRWEDVGGGWEVVVGACTIVSIVLRVCVQVDREIS